MFLIMHKATDTVCMDSLAEAHARIEEISSLQNIREAEYAAAAVARMEELQQHEKQSWQNSVVGNFKSTSDLPSWNIHS